MKLHFAYLVVAAGLTTALAPQAQASDTAYTWVTEQFDQAPSRLNRGSSQRNRQADIAVTSTRSGTRSGSSSSRRGARAGGYDTATAFGGNDDSPRASSRRQRFAASTVEDDVQFERPQRRTSQSRGDRGRGDRAPAFAERSLSGGESGVASYYWQPQRVASGGWFNPEAMTAAHKSLPFGTQVRVTRSDTGQSVVVTINDRGPYIAGRIIDLSRRAAQDIGMTSRGVVPVRVTILGRS